MAKQHDESVSATRQRWLRDVRVFMRQDEESVSAKFDAEWGEVGPAHEACLNGFLERLPPRGRVLDAACGTGKYFDRVQPRGFNLVGIDYCAEHLRRAAHKFPGVQTELRALHELEARAEFDGVMCVDAMEMLPPEEWPVVLRNFARALKSRGWLYVTIERLRDDQLEAATAEARLRGLPVVTGETVDAEGLYHFYPTLNELGEWTREAGFRLAEELAEPWEAEGYAYHHMILQLS